MSRAPARFTEADIKRVIRAAQACGIHSGAVEIAPDSTIRISLAPRTPARADPESVEADAPIVL